MFPFPHIGRRRHANVVLYFFLYPWVLHRVIALLLNLLLDLVEPSIVITTKPPCGYKWHFHIDSSQLELLPLMLLKKVFLQDVLVETSVFIYFKTAKSVTLVNYSVLKYI